MTKRKRRRLTKLNIEEVSFVDAPANMTPFLFHKRDGEVEKQFKGLDLSFSTKGTPDETTVTINGKSIADVRGLTLYYTPVGEDHISLVAEYTVTSKGETAGGFKSVKTFRLSKSEDKPTEVVENEDVVSKELDPEHLEVVKTFLGETIETMDGAIAEQLVEQIGVIDLYKTDFPPDLAEAIHTVVTLATDMEEVQTTTDPENTVRKEDDPKTTEPTAEQAAPTIDIDDLVSRVSEKVTESLTEKLPDIVRQTVETKEEPAPNPDVQTPKDELEDVSAGELGQELATVVAETMSSTS